MTCLEIAQLGELLSTVVKLAGEWLYLLVDDFMSTHIAALRKGLSTYIATVRTFTSVSSFVGLP